MRMQTRKQLLLATALLMAGSTSLQAQTAWKMKPVAIQSRWAKEVNPQNALTAYPRPQLERKDWQNLNGLWEYAITTADGAAPYNFDGQILVPYPLESALSGVKKTLLPDQRLWYRRRLELNPAAGERTLLHFGAVDWQSKVYLNGKEVGGHTGGYTSFTVDVTDVAKKGENILVLKIYDPSDRGVGPSGKQVLNPANIYYTPSSGIWQTVWLEKVPKDYISGLNMTPDIDKGQLVLTVNAPAGYNVEAVALKDGNAVGKIKGKSGASLSLKLDNPSLWSPGNPFLYDLSVKLLKGNTVVDEVKSYFGMRKVSIAKDDKGVDRIFLNNKPYFNLGTLDQGFWPDGLYTAPTDEALAFDIKAIKAMGFNTIRKHIKVEPDRWYYWADKLGMLVWQDMVSPNHGLPEGAKAAFEQQCKETLAQLHNYPCITTWVLFNEKWGQFDQQRLTEWIKRSDPSRLINGHSGEYLYVNEKLRSPSPNAYVSADLTDVHSYPNPMNAIKMPGKARVLGEFGGIGVFIPDHQWNMNTAWGYIQEKPGALKSKYAIMNQHLQLLEKQGLSASIYTQPFDVEGEQNGLLTYDREVVKIPFAEIRKIHAPLNKDMGTLPAVAAADADVTEPSAIYSAMLQEYIDGKKEPEFLRKLAMMAVQAGDKDGAAMAGDDYFALMKPPYSEDDLRYVMQVTGSTSDTGFAIIRDNMDAIDKAMGARQSTVKMMNLIYQDLIAPSVPETNANPDWSAIYTAVKPYGAPGEEIYLRARTIYLLNKQDKEGFKPVAREYLDKYGQFVKLDEKKKIEAFMN
ncbi:Glycosyl hydrolases family 2, TIM barrel domain [Chitinophaga arvensicola]|uniref:Glycosyl hydrolases family 2, TIM barrel domain n=2 Tax=Chitinophaga arvensicola TaxID=29529 RepID=A0A1I0SB74_9BACT|nr:Glycosyl hydrolases family 2, TIM barrel domain [Chitinophaga arvensicola]